MKFGRWFLKYANGQTDRQTDTLIAIHCTPPGGEVIIKRTPFNVWLWRAQIYIAQCHLQYRTFLKDAKMREQKIQN